MYYIVITCMTGFFLLKIDKAVSSGIWMNPVAQVQNELPFYFEDVIWMARKVKLCACGCGQELPYRKYYNTQFIYKHHNKGKNNPMYERKHTEKTKRLIRNIHKNSGKFNGENNPSYGSKKPHLSALNKSRIGIPIKDGAKEKQRIEIKK